MAAYLLHNAVVDTFIISSRKLVAALALSWFLLWLGSVLQDLAIVLSGTEEKIWLLDVDSEESLYTWFSTILLCVAALLALVLASSGKDTLQWRAIGLLFLAMSVDEMLSLHEKLSHPLSASLDVTGPFFFAWVIPAMAFVFLLAILFLPFVFRLPRGIAAMVITSAVLFVSGALGLEMAAGAFLSGEDNLTAALETTRYRMLTNLEEGLEGLGVLVFISALLIRCAQVYPSTFVYK